MISVSILMLILILTLKLILIQIISVSDMQNRMGWASHLGIAAALLPGFAPSLPAQDFLFRLFDTPGRMDTQRIGYEAPPPAGQGGAGYKDVSSGKEEQHQKQTKT